MRVTRNAMGLLPFGAKIAARELTAQSGRSLYAENVIRRVLVGATGLTVALLLALLALQELLYAPHAVLLSASASVLAALMIAACARRAGTLLLALCADGVDGVAVSRSSSPDVVVAPQRDPDAAGKPRPRAPGSNPSTV